MAGAVHVEERDDVAFLQWHAVYVAQVAAHRRERAGGDVAGDQRVGHAGEAAVVQVHVGATHFAAVDAQQRFAGAEFGQRVLTQLDVAIGSGEHGSPGGAHAGIGGRGPRRRNGATA